MKVPQRLKALDLLTVPASLKRCPDTNLLLALCGALSLPSLKSLSKQS
jgi:hypothetical protein